METFIAYAAIVTVVWFIYSVAILAANVFFYNNYPTKSNRDNVKWSSIAVLLTPVSSIALPLGIAYAFFNLLYRAFCITGVKF